jgi:hypothetical protein
MLLPHPNYHGFHARLTVGVSARNGIVRGKRKLMGVAYYPYQRPTGLVLTPYVQELCLTDWPFLRARIKKTSHPQVPGSWPFFFMAGMMKSMDTQFDSSEFLYGIDLEAARHKFSNHDAAGIVLDGGEEWLFADHESCLVVVELQAVVDH